MAVTSRTPPRGPSTPVGPVPRVRDWSRLVPVALALLCVAVYSNSFDAGFALDNRQLILRDTRVQTLSWENLRLILEHSYWWPYGESGLYRPLTTLSYLFNYAVLGHANQPAGYHAFNLLLHIANVLLLWSVALKLTASRWTAGATAAIWAAIPLSTEAVTNIVGRADLMAATASLGALLLYMRWRDRETRVMLHAAAVVALVLCGVLAKESAIAVLAVLAVLELLMWRGAISLRRLRLLAALCAPAIGWWAWQRAQVLAAGGPAEFPFTDNPIVGASFWQGRLTAIQVMWRYVALLVWPARLSNDYSYPQIPLAAGSVTDWVSVVLLAGGAAAALWQLRAHRPALFFAAFSLLMFLPGSNLPFATGTIMGERLVYLPSAGLAALAAIGLHAVARDGARLRAATAVVAAIVTAFGLRAYARNRDWKDDVTLWRSAVVAAPASAKAHRALAEALYDADPSHANLDEVMASADRAVALLEPLSDTLNTFQAFRQAGAYCLDKVSQLDAGSEPAASPESRRLYSRALNLLDRAVVIARHGAERTPGGSVEPEADAQRLRAAAILGLGNPPLALNAAKRARSLSPLHPLGYQLSASALLAIHSDEEAVMTLLTGSIVTGDRGLGQEAMRLYADGVDTEGCAVVGVGADAALNPRCATVVRHSCIASAAAYQILTKAGRAEQGAQVKAAALSGFGCPAGLMDRSNSLVP